MSGLCCSVETSSNSAAIVGNDGRGSVGSAGVEGPVATRFPGEPLPVKQGATGGGTTTVRQWPVADDELAWTRLVRSNEPCWTTGAMPSLCDRSGSI